eukprot:CAMPEP_0196572972 /NCGR_PEP_ID=MMETSP1081-20130531/2936_1 /TAXON_ID=36882 /ORGANISM="Pyramimonas amylifera, Strain CCMP720" /LENGTH=302 /DNA_ID=CAMNT_0041890499 /DNA_START=75 /DNA_END=980 /DNA_ORIENTATION=-
MSAEELTHLCDKLLKSANAVEEGNADRETKALDIIKCLLKVKVTTALLVETESAKRLRKVTKHPTASIASAASGLIKQWKATVTAEAAEKEKEEDKEVTKPIKVDVDTNSAKSERDDNIKSEMKNAVLLSPTVKPNTGDTQRDKLAASLGEALSKVIEESEDLNGLADPHMVGISIEAAMFRKYNGFTKDYKTKYRNISFNLKDPRNPDLRHKVLSGDIYPWTLLSLSPEELASDESRGANEAIRQHKMWECERGGNQQASTDQFKCGKCGERKTQYYQLQTRSADEPMTTFVTCVNCNNRW